LIFSQACSAESYNVEDRLGRLANRSSPGAMSFEPENQVSVLEVKESNKTLPFQLLTFLDEKVIARLFMLKSLKTFSIDLNILR